MGERAPSSIVSKRLTFFPESRCLRQENRTQENTGLFLRKADWLLFGNTRKEAPSRCFFVHQHQETPITTTGTVLVRFPKKSEQAFFFSPSEPPAPRRIRVARSTYLTVPCAQRYSPRRAVPRRTAPSHTGPHPCFVLFQREPPLFCLPQRVVRRKMRVTKRQFSLATNESAPKGCCFFSTGLPESLRAAGRPFCHGVIHKRSWLYLPFSKTSNFPYPHGSPGILRTQNWYGDGRPVGNGKRGIR